MAVDPVNRDILVGLPVANGDSVILRYCLTGQLLCLEPNLKNTDFGPDRVVTARTVVDSRRRNDLQKMHQVSASSDAVLHGIWSLTSLIRVIELCCSNREGTLKYFGKPLWEYSLYVWWQSEEYLSCSIQLC